MTGLFKSFSPAGPVFDPGSAQAAVLSHLFVVVLAICGVILGLVIALVTIALIRFRKRPASGEPRQVFGNFKLEVFWTVVPCLIVVGLIVLTLRAMSASDPSSGRPPDLIVVGHQWWWEVRYPASGVVTANEIHIPVGRRQVVRLESADVIHDFWVPQLGRKMDMIPGQPNTLELESDRAGVFEGRCAEYCGLQHAWMRFTVVAQPQPDFDDWIKRQSVPARVPESTEGKDGLSILKTMTCLNCHAVQGVSEDGSAGPDLTHVADRAWLGAGVLDNTPANLARWLKNPQAIKPGCRMPDLRLTDAQVADLVRYLEEQKT